jgi:L-fucose isomerase-like protein
MISNTKPRVAFVPLARSTFDTALAREMTDRARISLENAGYSLIGPAASVSSLDEATAVSKSLAGEPFDLLVLFQATFTDSTMTVHLVRESRAPVLLWALPEACTGGRLRLNSLCGINLAGHALRREGHDYEYVYAEPEDPAALTQIDRLARAGSVRRLLQEARIGRVGQHPEGFDSCRFNPDELKSRFGVEVIQIELEEVFERARRVDPKEVDRLLEELAQRLDGLNQLDPTALHGTLGSYVALKQIAGERRLHGMAVRCWPQFFTDLGCAACGAMSMLSDEGIPCSCEADVNGTVTQLILQGLSGEPAFGSDVVSVDRERNAAILWHCGLAPLCMADPVVKARGTIHSNRLLPLLMEFPLKPGRVTLSRLSESGGRFRLVVGSGEMLRAPLSFSGTSGLLCFDQPVSEVLDTIMAEGLEHHVSITYGDVSPALLALAKMIGLEVVHLSASHPLPGKG